MSVFGGSEVSPQGPPAHDHDHAATGQVEPLEMSLVTVRGEAQIKPTCAMQDQASIWRAVCLVC